MKTKNNFISNKCKNDFIIIHWIDCDWMFKLHHDHRPMSKQMTGYLENVSEVGCVIAIIWISSIICRITIQMTPHPNHFNITSCVPFASIVWCERVIYRCTTTNAQTHTHTADFKWQQRHKLADIFVVKWTKWKEMKRKDK